MSLFRRIRDLAPADPLMRKVLRNTGYLFSGSMAGTALNAVQGILVPVALGAVGYGVFGLLMSFATSVNRLLSFRMGELVIRYAGEAISLGQKQRASAIIRFAGLVEVLTSITAYALLVLLSPWAAETLLDNPSLAMWIRIYGLALLGNMLFETGTAVLQLANRFHVQAAIGFAQSLVTFVVVVLAYFLGWGLVPILAGYLAGKLLLGVATAAAAWRALPDLVGPDWHGARLGELTNRREMLGFAVSTNLSATVNLLMRDSEVLWVGYFLSPLEAGYYKLALTVMGLILMPIDPFIKTTYPEFGAAIAKQQWNTLRGLLRRTSAIAAAWTFSCLAGLLLLGRPILALVKDGEYLPSYPAILILLIGYGIANIFFWNRPLLLALGLPNEPLIITAVAGAVKTALMFVLVRPFGYLMQAALLSAYFAVSVGLIVWRGMSESRRREAAWRPQEAV